MFETNDILIVGDSFCRHRFTPHDWPMALTEQLTGKIAIPRGEGILGASWWSTRKNLIKETNQQPYKLLIICHTEATRIPNDYAIGINPMSPVIESVSIPDNMRGIVNEKDLITASKYYYEHLFCLDYHIWAQEQWFKELDQVLEKLNVPNIIHLHCFPPYNRKEPYKFKNGITVSNILKDQWVKSQDETKETRNHLTPENNIKFAKNLAKIIENYDTHPKSGIFNLFD